jgi:hypothetical protein
MHIADGPTGDRPLQLSAAISTLGQSVLVWDFRSQLHLKWLAASGVSQGLEAELGLTAAPVALTALYGGNIALRRGDTWTSILQAPDELALEGGTSTAPVIGPAPAWLSALISTDLFRARGGLAYAAVSRPTTPATPCAHTVQLFSPSGVLCGTLVFHWKDGACVPRDFTIGPEGTVVQQSPDDDCTGSGCHCAYHVWPGFL